MSRHTLLLKEIEKDQKEGEKYVIKRHTYDPDTGKAIATDPEGNEVELEGNYSPDLVWYDLTNRKWIEGPWRFDQT